MNLTEENPFPEEPIQEPIRLPPARRRRRRYLVSPGDDERAALLENLARRAFPTFEFFLFSLLCGAVLGAAYILDAQSLLLLGVLIAPLMTPWVGLTLASITGSGRFFLQTLGGLLIGGILVFGGSLLAGLAARIWLPLPLTLAVTNSHLWWPNLVVLALGAVLLVISFVRSEEKPFLPSVMLSYELFLPLSAAAFGLGCGLPDAWPNGLLVFLVHLALATFLGVIVLAFLRFRPATFAGYILAILILLLTLIVVLGLAGIGTFIPAQSVTPTQTLIPTLASGPTHSVTPAPLRTSTVTITPSPTGPTATPTLKIPASITPTRTITPQPTPVYARIYSAEGGGAIVRSEPGTGVILKSLINDYMIEVLPEVKTYNGVVWVRIRTPDGTEGWVMQSVLVFATPVPYWPPSATP
jgi:MFS family permease